MVYTSFFTVLFNYLKGRGVSDSLAKVFFNLNKPF